MPIPDAPVRGGMEAMIEDFKHKLAEQWIKNPCYAGMENVIRAAAADAAAIAWTTHSRYWSCRSLSMKRSGNPPGI